MSLKPSLIQNPSKKKSKRERDRENTRLYNSSSRVMRRVKEVESKRRNCDAGGQQIESDNLGQYGNSSESRIVPNKLSSIVSDASEEASKRKRLEYIEELKRARRELSFQRLYSPYISHRCCSLYSIAEKSQGLIDMPVKLLIEEKDARLSGMCVCDSPWCRKCSWKCTADRASRINLGVKNALDRWDSGESEESVWFFTPTVKRHHDVENQKLQLRRGWKTVKNYNDYRQRIGLYTYDTVRAIDITFKPWLEDVYHTHYHILVIFSDTPSVDEARRRLSGPWCEALEGVSLEDCQDVVRIVRTAEDPDAMGICRYIAKMSGLGLELSGTATTKTGNKGLSFAELLANGTKYGGHYIDIYQDFLKGIKGTNTCNFSGDWPKLDEDGIIREEPKVEIEIPPYWRWRVLPNQSSVTLIMYSAYKFNKWYIIRDFERMMACTDWKEVDRLCRDIGFSPHPFCDSKRYLWETWWNASRMVLGLEDCFFSRDKLSSPPPKPKDYTKPLFSCHNS
jgi:hypothetical protein